MKEKKIINTIYPKGLDFEFTKEEKLGYLQAVKDLNSFYKAIILKKLQDLMDDYNNGLIDSTDEWYREIIDLQNNLEEKVSNNKLGGVTIGDIYRDDTIEDGVVVDFIEKRYLLKSEKIYDRAVVEYTNEYKDKKNRITIPIWKIRVYNEKKQTK